jgi:ABC-type phosphate transport system substrate-binding protein
MRLPEFKLCFTPQAVRFWLAGFALASFSAAAADLVVIASANSGVSQLTKEQVSEIFLGKSSSLPGGGKAVLIDQPDSSPLRDAFYSKVTGKSASQVKSTWAKLSFTGKGIPPTEGSGNDDIKRQVAGNKNMLGYLDKSAVDGSVKIIFAP